MIVVSVNNEKKELGSEMNVAELLLALGFVAEKVAVAINTEFVPRSAYLTEMVRNNDRIDVLAPVQGG